MALEDEIINIEDLDIAKEIKIGDNILLETTDGTKLIDFKDFIIGTDNITFYDKISGGEFLQTADISALSANVDTNTTILSGISSIMDEIDAINIKLNAQGQGLEAFRNSIKLEGGIELEANTSATVGVTVSKAGNRDKVIYFTTIDHIGTSLVDGATGAGSINKGSTNASFRYTAKDTYNILITGNILCNNQTTEDEVLILQNDAVIGRVYVGTKAPGSDGNFDIGFIRNARVAAGDKISLSLQHGNASVKGGSVTISIL